MATEGFSYRRPAGTGAGSGEGRTAIAAYPPERLRDPGLEPVVSDRFERYETVQATVAAGTAFVEAGRFSGIPDAVDIWASASGLEVRLANEARAEESVIRTEAAAWVQTGIGRRVVETRDPAGAGGQTIHVLGKWAARHNPP